MGDYFCGWYFRCQSDSQTLAVIPAVHKSGTEQSCSIQLITDHASWNISFPITDFQKRGPVVQIGENRFSPQEMRLELHAACRAFYCFQSGGSILFALEAPNAAFEYEFFRE